MGEDLERKLTVVTLRDVGELSNGGRATTTAENLEEEDGVEKQ